MHLGRTASAAVALLFALAARGDAPKAAPRIKQYTIEQFMKSTRIAGASFSPDESRIYFSSNQTGIFNVFSAPAAGGEARPITHSKKESAFLVSAFPHDERILFQQDRGGDENSHLFVREADGNERDLTPGEKVKSAFYGWQHDGKAFFFGTNERDAKAFDVYRMDAAKLQRAQIYRAEDPSLAVTSVSQDGRYVALHKPNTTVDSDLYIWDAQTAQRRHISPHKGQATYDFAGFDWPVKNAYLKTNDGREFSALAKLDLASGKSTVIESPDWDVMFSVLSKNGRYRVTAVNEDARTRIKVVENATGKELKLPELGDGDITAVKISDSEKKMAFHLNGDRSPSDLFVLDIGSGKVSRITRALNPEIDPATLVESTVVRFKSFDGLQIPNVLFKPHQATRASKAPALVWVHGGPGGQTRKGYSAAIQFLANHGYVVLGINNRGSAGYGKTFYTADDQKHGKEPLWDCVEAKKYLQGLDYVDSKKIGIIGGSYGGYMTLAALAFQPDAFDAGVDIFGVSNWLRTLKAIPPYWESFRKVLYQEIGDPTTQEAMLREISPVFHADKIKKPLLVLQGANDPRVIKAESDDIVEQVKKNGVPVEYIVFPDEGHGFTKRENEARAYSSIVEFLDKHLKKAGGEMGAN
jgi:dipeptidyl aminopeptidase/acylaminoacyl peptidase